MMKWTLVLKSTKNVVGARESGGGPWGMASKEDSLGDRVGVTVV